MLSDIQQHIQLVEDSIAWASKYGKEAFPYNVFKDYRRHLRRIYQALEENCSAAAYGESQVGKSYLMSSLLSSPDRPFVITHDDKEYSFIDAINPSGGNNSQTESTGVITRFTLQRGPKELRHLVKVRNLTIVDIVLMLTDSYYNDVKINPDHVMRYDQINAELEKMSSLWNHQQQHNNELCEDDIRDIFDYVRETIGNAAAAVSQSRFCKVVAPVIQYVSYDKWVDVFSLLWNRNEEVSHLFSVLIAEYKKLNFQTVIYVPFEAIMRDKGTLLKIEWLDTVCEVAIDTGSDEVTTDVYNNSGQLLARDFPKGSLSALIAELTLEVPEELASERSFLRKLDLLDFPGARSREKYKEDELKSVLPKILRRGKVAYLFNKYSRSLRISSVLFCHHNNQKAEATMGESINDWIEQNIGKTPEERAQMLRNTQGVAPLFMIATKFNIDLERTKNDQRDAPEKLADHWSRFNTVLPEIIKPYSWLDEWVVKSGEFRSAAFQNIYPLRDFYWSGKNQVFDGYSDGVVKSPETGEHHFADYPDYFSRLKESFLRNEFVQKHFANPEVSWEEVATPNNDGSKAIIRQLDKIAGVLDEARRKRYHNQLTQLKKDMYRSLTAYYEPEDKEEKNRKVRQLAGELHRTLTWSVGEKPEVFGRIIDTLMVPVGDLRDIAYDIIVCRSETPQDFSQVHFIRKMAGINLADSREVNIGKLCTSQFCDEKELDKILRERGTSIEAVLSNDTEVLTTVADVVTKHIVDYWNDYVNSRVKVLETILPYAEEVVFMLTALLKKLNVKKVLSERIDYYSKVFQENELPNAIADFSALTLNNFVGSVGRDYMQDDMVEAIRLKAEKCQVPVNLSSSVWNNDRQVRPLKDTLNALDEATRIDEVSSNSLMKLPLWANFQRWENRMLIGLLFASDISQVDPEANERMRCLLEQCNSLYKE